MITKETATDIALAHREIEAAEQLLAKVREQVARGIPSDVRDIFGRPVGGLQLGIPNGPNGHNLYQVDWSIAEPVILAHIESQRRKLVALNNQASAEAINTLPETTDGR